MLEFIRRGVKSIFAKILLGVLVLSFAVWGIGDIFTFSGATAVGKVGDQEVSADQFADAVSRNQARISQDAGRLVTLAEMRDQGFGVRILQSLLRDATLSAEAAALGIRVPDDAVGQSIRDEPAFQGPDGEFSPTAYRAFLGQQNFSVPEFEQLRRTVMEQQLILGAVAGSTLPGPGTTARIAAHQGESRVLSTVRLSYDMAAAPVEPDDATLAAFLQANENRFREPERKFGAYLVVDLGSLADAAAPSEEELLAAYEAEADRFVSPAEAVLEQINFGSLEEAEAAAVGASTPAGFAALASERGLGIDDIALGTVGPGDLPPAVSDAVFAQSEAGVVGPIETPLGAAIVNVIAVAPERATPFEDVREQLSERMALEAAYARTPELAGLIDEQRAEGRSFDEIADALDGVETGEIAGWAADSTVAEGEAPLVFATQPARTELLTALDLEERDLVELPDGGYFLARIDRIEPAFLPELDDIRNGVGEAWINEQRLTDLEEQGERIVTALGRGTGATLGSMAAGMGRTAQDVGPLPRGGVIEGLDGTAVAEAFSLNEGGAFVARGTDGESVYVVALERIEEPAPEALAAASEELETAFRSSLGRDIAEYFARAAQEAHGASIDEAAVSQTFDQMGAAQHGGGYGHGG
ncbi:MAG: SurA N-terminal domain-containing protein [Pseudomonadota bacterium]